jgi:hypothetical protein
VKYVGGNASDARESAYNAWQDAKRANADPKDIAILEAAFRAKREVELSQTGGNRIQGYDK